MTDYSQQISQIQRARSLEDIREIARQFSAKATSEGGVLYSRAVGGVPSEVIALELAHKTDLAIINKTPRAEFLSDPIVKDALHSSARRVLSAQGVPASALDALALDFQYGSSNAVANSLTSLDGCLWGDASREFAASMRGDIKVVATAANMERVFGKVELPTILENPHVQTLGGRPIAELRAIAAKEGAEALLNPVQAQFVEAAPRGIYQSAGTLSITTEPVLLSREFADAMGVDSSRFPPAANLSASGTVVRADIGMAVQVAQDEVRLIHASTVPEHVPTERLRTQGAAVAEAAPGFAAADGTAPHPRGSPGLKAAGIAGTALLAYDFGTTGHKWVQLHSQGNQAGADSTAAHFVGRNVGGAMGGFIAGAGVGALTGSWTGPGALLAGLGGGVAGAYMGERWAEQKDLDRIYTQTDPLGRTWMQDPQGRWLRGAHQQQVQTSALAGEVEVRPVQTALGEDVLFRADYVATGRLERLLNHKAANASYELGLDNLPPPQNPFRLDASTEQLPARTPDETGRAFVRHPQSRQWQLEIAQALDGRIPSVRHEAVSAERALELDQHARTVIAQNAANSPAAMASRYRVAYEQGRWSDFDPALPPAISHALEKSDTLRASDGNTYTRLADDQWVSSGVIYNSTADLNLRDELELTWQSQRAGMQEMNTLADQTRATLRLEPEGVRGQLAALYATHGIHRNEAQLDAAVAAVERNHVRDEVLADFTLELMPDPRTRLPSADSAVASFSDDGGNRMLLKSTTTAEEVAKVQLTAGGPQETPVPESPELRIAALSPQEREAHQQALREANREGATAQEAQQAASFAAVNLHASHVDEVRAPKAAVDAQWQRDPHHAPDTVTMAAASAPVAASPPVTAERAEQSQSFIQRDVLRPDPDVRPAPAVDDSARQGVPIDQPAPIQSLPAAHDTPQQPAAARLPEPSTAPAPLDPKPDSTQQHPIEDHPHRREARPAQPPESVQTAPLEDPSSARTASPPTASADAASRSAQQATPQPAITPMQTGHPDHALYQQIREHVTALDAKHGRTFDETSERMTASLLVLAKDNGLDRVDHVLLSNATAENKAAHYVFVVQGEPSNPAHQRGAMPTEQAAKTPVEESLQRFEVVSQEQRAQAQQLEQQLTDARAQQENQTRGMSLG